jgi:hypothetical protein
MTFEGTICPLDKNHVISPSSDYDWSCNTYPSAFPPRIEDNFPLNNTIRSSRVQLGKLNSLASSQLER